MPLTERRCSGRHREEAERLRLERRFDGDIKSCLDHTCYVMSCLFNRCYVQQIFTSLRIGMDERRTVTPLDAVVASTDGRTGKDDTDLSHKDGLAAS